MENDIKNIKDWFDEKEDLVKTNIIMPLAQGSLDIINRFFKAQMNVNKQCSLNSIKSNITVYILENIAVSSIHSHSCRMKYTYICFVMR